MEIPEELMEKYLEEFQCIREAMENIASELEIQNNLKRQEMEENKQ